MHHGPEATRAFFGAFDPSLGERPPRVLIFPPAVSLHAAVEARHADVPVELGVQNVHWEPKGAFTGETSVAMAREGGAAHVLIGHSERRHTFRETDEEVALKVSATLDGGLAPVICVGETLEERRAGRVREVILGQLNAALEVLAESGADFMIAYEPVWAIGTGETATPQDASEAHGALRERLSEALGAGRAGEIPILYGGSVKPENAAELLRAPEVDGVLVGGASLDPASFARIAEST
jgi:triosephosphate isomerase (TIM)